MSFELIAMPVDSIGDRNWHYGLSSGPFRRLSKLGFQCGVRVFKVLILGS